MDCAHRMRLFHVFIYVFAALRSKDTGVTGTRTPDSPCSDFRRRVMSCVTLRSCTGVWDRTAAFLFWFVWALRVNIEYRRVMAAMVCNVGKGW